MSTSTIRIATGALSATAAIAIATAIPAAHAASTSPSVNSPQRFAMSFVTVGTQDRPVHVVASGPISGTGTVRDTILHGTATTSDLISTITLRNGTVRLRVHETYRVTPNLRTCTATNDAHGTWRITSGTGAYARATGNGTFVRTTFIVGRFGTKAQCLGQSAPPVASSGTVVMSGTARR